MIEKERMRWIWETVRRNIDYLKDYEEFQQLKQKRKKMTDRSRKRTLKDFINFLRDKRQKWLLPVPYNPDIEFEEVWKQYQMDKKIEPSEIRMIEARGDLEVPEIFYLKRGNVRVLKNTAILDSFSKSSKYRPPFLDPTEVVVVIDMNAHKTELQKALNKLIDDAQDTLRKRDEVILPRDDKTRRAEKYDKMLEVWDLKEKEDLTYEDIARELYPYEGTDRELRAKIRKTECLAELDNAEIKKVRKKAEDNKEKACEWFVEFILKRVYPKEERVKNLKVEDLKVEIDKVEELKKKCDGMINKGYTHEQIARELFPHRGTRKDLDAKISKVKKQKKSCDKMIKGGFKGI